VDNDRDRSGTRQFPPAADGAHTAARFADSRHHCDADHSVRLEETDEFCIGSVAQSG